MIFLGFWSNAWKLITGQLDLWQTTLSLLVAGLEWILYTVSKWFNGLISYMYNLFYIICTQRLLDNDTISVLARRIGLILGILMVLVITFSGIKMMLDPDGSNKNGGFTDIVKKVLVVIMALGISTTAFNMLYGIQNAVINSNIISKILLPFEVNTNDFGAVLGAEIFTAFYSFNEEIDVENSDDDRINECHEVYKNMRNYVINGNYEEGYDCLSEKIEFEDGTVGDIINFHGIFLLMFSIAALYFLFGYCITVGVRTIQLAFLEIISPIAIISYLSPNKNSNKLGDWCKIYFSTYIDVFIRIAIINFSIYLIATIFEKGSINFADYDGTTGMFVKVIMIMAILTFAKKAPELLKQLLPSGGASGLDFGLGSAKSGLGMLSFGAGAITGGIAGAGMSAVSRFNANRHAGNGIGASLRGLAGGAFSGGIRGIASGAKKGNMFKNVSAGINKQRGIDNAYGSMITSGGSSWGRIKSKVADTFGETTGQRATRQMGYLDTLAQHKKNINSTAADMTAVNAAKTAYENMTQWKGESIEDFNARKQAANDYWRGMRNAAADASLAGKNSFEYNGQTYQFKDDDMARASQIRAELAQAEDFVTSHDVQHWDEEKGTMVKIDSLYEYTTNEKGEQVVDWNVSRGNLGNTENYAMETNAHFARDSKYQSSMANDRAAGVDSEKKK